jgi:hypothetical protein
MQTLGLSGKEERSDGRLKSIFWPTVENAWDVNALGQQGFWICLAIAAFQIIGALISGNIILMVAGAAAALVFVVGALGVRESNWPAAALLFAIYFLGLLYSMAGGHFPGILAIVAAAILLSNVRAAFLASEWRPAAEGEDKPMRFNESWIDKLSDQLPAKAWPVLQIPFFSLASILLLLTLIGLCTLLLRRFGILAPIGALHP